MFVEVVSHSLTPIQIIIREEEENNLSQMKKLFFYMFG